MTLFRPFFATAALAAVVFSGQAQSATPDVLHEGLLKVSLTDFISGKYSLSYERVVGDWTTAELTVTGIGMTTTDYTYTIAQPCALPVGQLLPQPARGSRHGDLWLGGAGRRAQVRLGGRRCARRLLRVGLLDRRRSHHPRRRAHP